MRVEELIQRVQSLYSKGVQSDDTRLSNRYIYNALRTSRALFISKKRDKQRLLSSWYYQTLPCVELEEIPLSECPCTPIPGCRRILRSVHPIPSTMGDRWSENISKVSSLDDETFYHPLSVDAVKYHSGSKYVSGLPTYFISNNHIYTTFIKGPRVVKVTAIFDDPIGAMEFPSACDENLGCASPLDMEFPIDEDLIEPMIQMVIGSVLQYGAMAHEDTRNNTKEDVNPYVQKPKQNTNSSE